MDPTFSASCFDADVLVCKQFPTAQLCADPTWAFGSCRKTCGLCQSKMIDILICLQDRIPWFVAYFCPLYVRLIMLTYNIIMSTCDYIYRHDKQQNRPHMKHNLSRMLT